MSGQLVDSDYRRVLKSCKVKQKMKLFCGVVRFCGCEKTVASKRWKRLYLSIHRWCAFTLFGGVIQVKL